MRDAHDVIDSVKHAVDAVSVGIFFATLVQWVTPVAGILTIIWTLIRIYETKTVRALLGLKPPT